MHFWNFLFAINLRLTVTHTERCKTHAVKLRGEREINPISNNEQILLNMHCANMSQSGAIREGVEIMCLALTEHVKYTVGSLHLSLRHHIWTKMSALWTLAILLILQLLKKIRLHLFLSFPKTLRNFFWSGEQKGSI